jgi:hypothetical protein
MVGFIQESGSKGTSLAVNFGQRSQAFAGQLICDAT